MRRTIMHGNIDNGLLKLTSIERESLMISKNNVSKFTLFFSLFDDELVYVDRLISDDVRNNSAWNQRFFVLKHTGFTQDVLQREINYVMNRIRFVKNNESTWNFLRGLLQQGDGTMDQFPEVGVLSNYPDKKENSNERTFTVGCRIL